MKFGRLTVVSRSKDNIDNRPAWVCKCESGNLTTVRGNLLRRGETKSCGCYRNEMVSKANSKHGMSQTSFYHIWKSMIQRCNNPNSQFYKYYGGRGIKVCDEWMNENGFINFMNDMYEKYLIHKEKYDYDTEIDRLNCNLGYSKNNCEWVTRVENMNNTRRSKKYEQ